MKNVQKWAVLVGVLILPFLIYYLIVYSAEENFFQPLESVGPPQIVQTEEGWDSLDYHVPHWSFTGQNGEELSSDDLKNTIYLASFFFTRCPSICPSMNFRIQQHQERFRGFEDFRIISFSVDPDNDTVEALKAYSERFRAEDGLWYFLTGERNELYRTAGHYLLSAQEDTTADGGFLHSEQLVLVDWEGRIRSRKDDDGNVVGSYNTRYETEMRDLSADIKVLIAEFEKEKARREYLKSKAEK